MSLSLYNKYRPQTFADVVGQEHVEKTLANAVSTGSVSHAYLFTGSRGTGKTTTARLLAKALLCEHAPTATPDGSCRQCIEISDGVHPDVYEMDAASRTGVDNVRDEIINRVQYAPTHGNFKIYIIDEVHMLSTAAFNSLLKTLEEPPSHVIFVLCTTDVQKVPDTVVARCQRFDFHRFSAEEIFGRLRYICEQEGYSFDETALDLIARRAAGGMRDAIGALEQVAVFGGNKVTYAAAEIMLSEVNDDQMAALALLLAAQDAAGCFEWVANFAQSGSDIAVLVSDFAVYIRNLYVVALASASDERLGAVLEVGAAAIAAYRKQAEAFGAVERLSYILTVLGDLSSELKDTANARLALEIALTRIVRPQTSLSLEALAARVAALESGQLAPGLERHRGQLGEQSGAGLAVEAAGATAGAATGFAADAAIGAAAKVGQNTSVAVANTAPSTQYAAISVHGTDAGVSPQTTENSTQEHSYYIDAEHSLLDRVVDRIRDEKISLYAHLGGAQPHLNAEAKSLTIELPPKAGLSKTTLEKPDNLKYVAELVAKINKAPLSIRYVLGQEAVPVHNLDAEIDPDLLDEVAVTNVAAKPATETAAEAATETASEPAPKSVPKPDPETATETAAETVLEPASKPAPKPDPETAPSPEPSKEDLESILSASVNSAVKFEEL